MFSAVNIITLQNLNLVDIFIPRSYIDSDSLFIHIIFCCCSEFIELLFLERYDPVSLVRHSTTHVHSTSILQPFVDLLTFVVL